MKHIVHVNQHRIRSNMKNGTNDPVLIHRTYKGVEYGYTASLVDADGRVLGRFRYEPENPLSCGARVWFESEHDIIIEGDDQ